MNAAHSQLDRLKCSTLESVIFSPTSLFNSRQSMNIVEGKLISPELERLTVPIICDRYQLTDSKEMN